MSFNKTKKKMLFILSQILLPVYELYFYLLKKTARIVRIFMPAISLCFPERFATTVLNKEYFRMGNTAKRSCLCVTITRDIVRWLHVRNWLIY